MLARLKALLGIRPPSAGPRTYTQTYSTADRTVPAATYAAPTIGANTVVLTATNIASKTASLTLAQSSATNPTDAQFDQLSKDVGTAINTLNTNVGSLNTQLVALAADVLALKKNLTAIVDDLQDRGIVL